MVNATTTFQWIAAFVGAAVGTELAWACVVDAGVVAGPDADAIIGAAPGKSPLVTIKGFVVVLVKLVNVPVPVVCVVVFVTVPVVVLPVCVVVVLVLRVVVLPVCDVVVVVVLVTVLPV